MRPAVISLFFAIGLAAQTPLGEIQIEVEDSSGASIPARGRLNGAPFETAPDGTHRFPDLPFGNYRLLLEKRGFASALIPIRIDSATPARRIVTLLPASLASRIDVVSTTPLPGSDLSLDEIPANIRTLTQRDFEQTNALDLSNLLNRKLSGIHINETQGNPFQPDVNYRGYTASPLLGTPEGISVYMDGVRMNQPFADIVSWDLIPRMAISDVSLIPGSNPLFGLNTLGGALSIQTKDGASSAGTTMQVSGGSFGRRAVEFGHGGSLANGFNWYLAGNLFHEDGWREASPTDVRQAFTKLGWQTARSSISLTGSFAHNDLIGNGLQEERLLARDYSSVYTIPDITNNRAPFLNLTARHSLAPRLTFAGNAYFRYIRADTFNGDVNDDSLDQSVYQPSAAEITVLRNAGYTGIPLSGANASNTPFPSLRCIAQVILNDEPAEKCNGIINRTSSKQHNYGLSGQIAHSGGRNRFTIGAARDRSSSGFHQTAQLGYINPDRSITPLNSFADGINGGEVDGEPFDTRVDLRGLVHTSSVFGTDALSVRNLSINLSGRYNRTIVDNRDRIQPGGGPGSLDGHHIFQRFNPSVGMTYRAAAGVNAFASYSEGSRAPTSIELGCADPNEPCKLPNAFAGDPPLEQVVTRTVEAGLRGQGENALQWSANWFRAMNDNDLLFVSSTATGFGYFRNFGETRRQGVEANLQGTLRRMTLGGAYTFLDATYQTAEIVGEVPIAPGDRIPLIPRHTFKAFADIPITSRIKADVDFQAVSTSFARGDENNTGTGRSAGYAVTNLGASYQATRQLRFFIQVNNLFDRTYYTAAQRGPTAFNETGAFVARPLPAVNGEFPLLVSTFYAPGAPRGVFAGMRLTF